MDETGVPFTDGRERRHIPLHEYEELAAREFGWKCESCEKYTEDGVEGRYCRYCGDYWQDVRNGLFDD